ncbi:MAG: acetyl-CoA carboxylase biotin carboxyl carrier protein [Beijerinckiaceae bacterium]
MAKAPQPKKIVTESSSAIDTKLVRAIADLLTETNVGEIEVAKGDLKIRVARFSAAPAAAPQMVMQAAPVSAPVAPAGKSMAKSAEVAAHPGTVKSPMVGTAYLKPSPDAKVFVEIGSSVKAGEKIMLIEAMKTFNDITAPQSGTVTAILVSDGQPVEFGQPLFVIE